MICGGGIVLRFFVAAKIRYRIFFPFFTSFLLYFDLIYDTIVLNVCRLRLTAQAVLPVFRTR